MSFKIVIPARWASERLPGKPLRDIAGRPMILRTLDQAREAGADEVVVAVDDVRIAEIVTKDGGQVEMTRSDHVSGTDRISECATRRGWETEKLPQASHGWFLRSPSRRVTTATLWRQGLVEFVKLWVEPVQERPDWRPATVRRSSSIVPSSTLLEVQWQVGVGRC